MVFCFFFGTATESSVELRQNQSHHSFPSFKGSLLSVAWIFKTQSSVGRSVGSGPGSWKGVKIGKLPFWIEVGGLKKWPVIWCHYISIHSSSRYYHPISEKFG